MTAIGETSPDPDRPGAGREAFFPDGRTSLPPENNVEMRWEDVDPDRYLTPNERFFVRSHGATPTIDPLTWRLRIDGDAATRPVEVTLDELKAMPSVTAVHALECAGNGRAFFEAAHGRTPPGALWGLGAIGVAEWTGASLTDVLARAGIEPSAREVVPWGLDELRVRRPVPIERATRPDTIVALQMNDEPLPADHGFPARLIVPGWAAVASVKWLGRLEVTARSTFTWWNTEHYVLRGPAYDPVGPGEGEVIRAQVMKSALELPRPARLPAGPLRVTGRSWSPDSSIARVQVSVDDGSTWMDAKLREPNLPGAWVRWSFRWDAEPGAYVVKVRATDANGSSQPDAVPWNERGYLFGAVVGHPVEVVPPGGSVQSRSRA